MATTSQYIQAVKNLKANFERDIAEVVEKASSQEIADIIRNRLFNKGEYADGSRLRDYTEDYIHYVKRPLNQPFDRTTLMNTGDFYQGMFAYYNQGKVGVFSTDSKTNDILFDEHGYGEKVFAFNDQESEKVTKSMIEPLYKANYLSKLPSVKIEFK